MAGASGNDPEIDAIVQLCLEMEEEFAQSLQSDLLPQAQWTTYEPPQQVPGNQWDLQASAQSGSLSAWGGLPPYSTHVPLTHQGPSMQSGYGSLTPSANSWEAPESPGEGPSTSAWGSTLLPQSVGSSLTTGSLEYGAPMPPVDDTAPASLQGHDASSFAYATSGGVPSGYFGAGSALPQAQLWAQPNSSTQLDQHPPQQDMHSLFYETPSARKRGLEEHAMWNPPISPKRLKAPSIPGPGMPQEHETGGYASLAGNQELQQFKNAEEGVSEGFRQDGTNSVLVELLARGPALNYLIRSRSLSPSALLEGLSGPSRGTVGPTGNPADNSTPGQLPSSKEVTTPRSPTEHPFYNTPVLEPGAVAKPFSLLHARRVGPRADTLGFALRFMHSLIVRDTLYSVDLNAFVGKMEALAGYLLHFHMKPVLGKFPQECCKVLGLRYLVLDTLFVGSTILAETGQDCSWWAELVENVPNRVDLSSNKSYGDQYQANVYLATELSKAIQQLKQGTRPSREKTILLKRLMFCKVTSPPYFKRREWDLWRADDHNYGGRFI
ncbi:hypothetical protein EBH_0014900 [Eimeria brunetti]|uniref:Uncharacterized protein n=1 Tax=Eimeria brunetti TaxID=51314 RepID=U6L9P7_9EIME|nr:hypothetical protein EBH_0014900 [Eimeria brunetti]